MYACLFIKVIQIVMIKPHKLTPQKNCKISHAREFLRMRKLFWLVFGLFVEAKNVNQVKKGSIVSAEPY